MWSKCKDGECIIFEVYNNNACISIRESGEIAPYEIECSIYGFMIHTASAETIEEAYEKYEEMKAEIQMFIDNGMNDDDWCERFTWKWL